MNFSQAVTILENKFNGVLNQAEKTLLESMLVKAKKTIRTKAILIDLLTNDFDSENCGFLVSCIAEYQRVYSKRDIINLANLVKPTAPKKPDEIKKPLIKKIEALKIKIDKFTCTVEESQIDYDKINDIFKRAYKSVKTINEKEIEFMRGENNSGLISAMVELASYRETLAADLIHITTDYAIVSKALTSPAGFHPSERIFLQPTICIQTNNRNQKAPACNLPLYLSDLRDV